MGKKRNRLTTLFIDGSESSLLLDPQSGGKCWDIKMDESLPFIANNLSPFRFFVRLLRIRSVNIVHGVTSRREDSI